VPASIEGVHDSSGASMTVVSAPQEGVEPSGVVYDDQHINLVCRQ
jgi:hypothetical protein